jgi:hypothetical protein
VQNDLLGAGPKSVDELRSIAGRLRIKYQNQLDRRIQRAQQQEQQQKQGATTTGGVVPPPQIKDVMDKASSMAGGLFAKMKNPGFPHFNRKDADSKPAAVESEPAPTIVDLPPPADMTAATTTTPESGTEAEGDWAGTDIAPATDAISNFSIGDDEDDDIL